MQTNKQPAPFARYIALVLAGAGIGAGSMYVAAVPNTISLTKSPVPDTYYAVTIGSTRDEVGYKLGYPTKVMTPFRDDPNQPGWKISDDLDVNKSGNVDNKDPSPGRALKQFHTWRYIKGADWVDVVFDPDNDKLLSISCMGTAGGRRSNCQKLAGVGIGTSEADLREKLGKPSNEDITAVFKLMDYRHIGVRFMLDKRGVYSMALYAPDASTTQK